MLRLCAPACVLPHIQEKLIRPHSVRGARDHATEVAHARRSGASENEGDIAGAAIYLVAHPRSSYPAKAGYPVVRAINNWHSASTIDFGVYWITRFRG